MTPEEGRYSKVTRRIWNDAKFRRLSAPKPNAQTLLFRLLTAPESSVIPGLIPAWLGGISESLGWGQRAFDRCFAELEREGIVRCDRVAGLIWIPNAIRHNAPTSPNVVASWRAQVKELPECSLLHEAIDEIGSFLEEMGEAWVATWRLSENVARRPGKVPRDVREQVQARDGDQCRYCGRAVNWKDRRGPSAATYDHVDPSGPSTAENIVISCRSCSSMKGFRTPEDAGLRVRSIQDEPRPEPRSKPRNTKTETRVGTSDPSANQEQEQEQEQEDPVAEVAPKTSQVIGDDQRPASAAPRNLHEALKVPVRQRAQLLVKQPHTAMWLEPQRWPEVQALAEGFASKLGWHVPNLSASRPDNSTVMKLVELLAMFTAADLERAQAAAVSDDFLHTGRKGLGSLSQEVVGRLLTPNRGVRKPGSGTTRQPSYGFSAFDGIQFQEVKAR